ncbi:hypothetical protein SAT01_08070 [Sinomonas atrocyanea]|nr:hypothetical protein SAT01_08070 [Sinomonas atrocyanea]GGG53612.1 hypothetical protein GCM10007172_00920 [Sinomonas atrocyanea]
MGAREAGHGAPGEADPAGGASPSGEYAAGRAEGYTAGQSAGYAAGYAEGHRAGYFEGHRAGWEYAVHGPAAPPDAAARPEAPAAVRAQSPEVDPAPAGAPVKHGAAAEPGPKTPPAEGVASATWLTTIRRQWPVGPDTGAPESSPVQGRLRATSAPEGASADQVAEEAARRRERRGVQSANIALYAAALLIVAAAGLFLSSSVAESLRLAGLAGVTALFYTAGLVVHAKFVRLRPAAVAFAGTGLALLPVTGLGLDIVVLHDASLSWLITSAVGLVAFGFAALRLESRVLVFLSLTFLFSAAWSGTEVLGGALAADFAALIAAAALLAVVSATAPRWVPPLFLQPVARLHPWVVPSTFVAATVAAGTLERGQYPLLTLAMGIYLAAQSFLADGRLTRRLSWWGARAAAAVAAGVGAAQAVDAGFAFGSERWPATAAGAVAASAAIAAMTLAAAALGSARAGSLGLPPRIDRAEQVIATVLQAGLVAVASASGGPLTREPAFAAAALLAVTAQLVAWRWGRQAEWLPVVAFVEALLVRLEAWPLAWLLMLGFSYFAARAAWPSAGWWRLAEHEPDDVGRVWERVHFVAAARLASIPTAAAVVAAVLAGTAVPSPARVTAVAFGIATAAAVQLAVTGVLGAVGQREFLPRAMVWMLGACALISVAVVGVADMRFSQGTAPGPRIGGPVAVSPLLGPAVSVLCAGIAALAVGLYLVRPPRAGRLSVGEVAPATLLGLLALELYAFARGSLALPVLPILNSVLVLATAVLGASAWRAAARLRRWSYIWLARTAATLLAAGIFWELQLHGWSPTVAGQPVTLADAMVAVIIVQVFVPLAVELRGRRTGQPLPWALGDATVVLAAAVPGTAGAALGVGTATPDTVSTVGSVLVLALAVSAALTGAVLRFRRGSVAVAPAALVLTGLLAAPDLRLLELLAALFAVFSAAMVYLAPQTASKGAHLVAARALPVALAALVAQDATASPTWVSVVLAAGLAAQHLVRQLLRDAAARLPFQEAAYWSGLVGQLALPFAYLFTARQGAEGGRWVVLLEAALVVVSVLGTLRAHPAAGYLGAAALLFGVVALGPLLRFQPGQVLVEPLLGGTAVALVLVAVALLHIVGMARWEHGRPEHGLQAGSLGAWPWSAAAGAFGAAAVLASVPERLWVSGVAIGACAAVLLAASYVWRGVPAVLSATFPLGVLLTLPAGTSVAHDLVEGFAPAWQVPAQVLMGTLTPAAIGLALRWSARWPGDAGRRLETAARFAAEPIRRWSLAGVAAAALVLSARAAWDPPAVVLVPVLAAALVAMVVPELPARVRRLGLEAGVVLLVAAVQRAVFAGDEEPSAFWLAQWYAVGAAVIALLRYYVGRQVRAARIWLEGSAALLSLSGIWVAATAGDNAQQVWLLIAFAVLTLAGLVLGERRFTAWGAVGVVACVLWSVRAYVYALLGILGLALIAAAVWWLERRPRGTLLR